MNSSYLCSEDHLIFLLLKKYLLVALISVDQIVVTPRKEEGVGFYISNSLAWQQVTNIESDLELIVIKILPKLASPFIIISLYRPPDLKASLFFSSFHYILDQISSYPIDLYILGDLNFDLLHLDTKLGSEFLSFMESYQLSN